MIKTWNSMIDYPSVFSIVTANSVLHSEFAAFFKRIAVNIKVILMIVRVKIFCPALSNFLV